MRRFINSRVGKVVSNVVALSLFVPYVTLITATRAVAQVITNPSWAVLDFVNTSDRGGPSNLGSLAADAVRTELEKTKKYDPVPRETIDRFLASLDLQQPVTQKISLLRLGQQANAASVVTGEIRNWRIVKDAQGKHADLLIRVDVLDVASGIVVNGTVLSASSTVRPSETADDILLADALKTAAFQAVSDITSRELPRATILNTSGDNKSALINAGSRAGFKDGQELIIMRGREQVGSGVIAELEPDGATITILRSTRGVQPGDRARAIFTPPDMKKDWGRNGDIQLIKPAPKHPNTGLLTALAVIGLIVITVGMNPSGQGVLAQVKAQATTVGGLAGVKVSWSPDMFTKGTSSRTLWQIYRNDFQLISGSANVPIMTTPGSQITCVNSASQAIGAYQFSTIPSQPSGGYTCTNATPLLTASTVATPMVVSGIPYIYSVALIYMIPANELPNGTLSTGLCYFISDPTNATGQATPYDLPTLTTPNNGDTISGAVTFSWNASGNVLASGEVAEYVVEISPSISFLKSQVITLSKFQSNAVTGTTLTAGPFDLTGVFPASSTLYWRIGVRDIADKPGPLPDIHTGEPYIFSIPRTMAR